MSTPEWTLKDGANSHIFDGRILDGLGNLVAFAHLDWPETQWIVAAPDMLQALNTAERALHAAYCQTRSLADADNFAAARDAVRAAIAKAQPPSGQSGEG